MPSLLVVWTRVWGGKIPVVNYVFNHVEVRVENGWGRFWGDEKYFSSCFAVIHVLSMYPSKECTKCTLQQVIIWKIELKY